MKRMLWFLLLMPFVVADVEEHSVGVNVDLKFNTNILNITTQDGSRSYDCTPNSSYSFSYTQRKNITLDCDDRNVVKLSNDVGKVLDACNDISSQYGDSTKYYTLYTACAIEKAICDKDVSVLNTKVAELAPMKTNYESCSGNILSLQGSIDALNEDLTIAESNSSELFNGYSREKSNNWFFGIIGAAVMGALWAADRRKTNPQTNRQRLPMK